MKIVTDWEMQYELAHVRMERYSLEELRTMMEARKHAGVQSERVYPSRPAQLIEGIAL